MQSFFKAQYYAKPDGEDYVGKMCATNRLAIQGALGVSMIDVIMYTKPVGFLPKVVRFAWWIGPAIGMASAFTTGTYLATRMRGKDDKLNYIVGSCAAAGIAGAWQKNFVLGCSMCIFFTIAGAIKKNGVQEGWEFFPEKAIRMHEVGSTHNKRFDFTLTKEGEKGWTTGKE